MRHSCRELKEARDGLFNSLFSGAPQGTITPRQPSGSLIVDELYVVLEGRVHRVDLEADVLTDGQDFFARMDADMDRGWQMSREWVEHPDRLARCQIAADRLVQAMLAGNRTLAMLMAGYILDRMPGTVAVVADTTGEMSATEFLDAAAWQANTRRPTAEEAAAQAEREVSPVHKVGKVYRHAVYDRLAGRWVESDAVADPEQAERLRAAAVARRREELLSATLWLGG